MACSSHPGNLGHDTSYSASEHRDTQAIHAKLDEILHALGDAETKSPKWIRRSPRKSSDGESMRKESPVRILSGWVGVKRFQEHPAQPHW